jgi:RNA polymerase sporulation-specific sigma factor
MEYKEKGELEKLAIEHTGLVKSIAIRLSHVYGEEIDDLIQIGYIGLLKAIKGFDKDKGFKFSTYAVPVITGEIRSQLRDQGAIKISRSIKADIVTIKKAEEEFINMYNRSPRISELASHLEFTEERVKEAINANDAMKNIGSYDEVELALDEEETNITKIDIKDSLSKLEENERKIMVLSYYKDMTQSQVAKVIGISQVQVSRIEKKTLKNMANFMDDKQKNKGG